MGRVNDGSELFDTIHPKVGYAKEKGHRRWMDQKTVLFSDLSPPTEKAGKLSSVVKGKVEGGTRGKGGRREGRRGWEGGGRREKREMNS